MEPARAVESPPGVELAVDDRITDFGLLLEAVSRLGQIIDRSIRQSVGISQAFFEALLRIERSGGSMTMGCLAGQILITTGGVTRLVDRLADHGYAERRPCESDRRVQYVAITENGREVLARALEVHLRDLQREYIGRMTPDELEVVSRVMDRLRRGADEPVHS